MENVVFQGAKSACAKLQLDAKPSEKILAVLNAEEHIYNVHLVQRKPLK